jgi:hypothetical protein
LRAKACRLHAYSQACSVYIGASAHGWLPHSQSIKPSSLQAFKQAQDIPIPVNDTLCSLEYNTSIAAPSESIRSIPGRSSVYNFVELPERLSIYLQSYNMSIPKATSTT